MTMVDASLLKPVLPFTPKTREERERIRMECRSLRHNMKRKLKGPANWLPPTSEYWWGAKHILHRQCDRCGTWRHIAIDHRGQFLVHEYVWPDWYRQDDGEGYMDHDAIRLWEAEDNLRQLGL